jgi:hypothetical protein
MNPTDYQQLAARTECVQATSRHRMYTDNQDHARIFYPNDHPICKPIRFNHSIIGMCGEVGEIFALLNQSVDSMAAMTQAEQVSCRMHFNMEFGDLLWYMAEGMNALSMDATTIFVYSTLHQLPNVGRLDQLKYVLTNIAKVVGLLASELQRWIYYGKYEPSATNNQGDAKFIENVVYLFRDLAGWVQAALGLLDMKLDRVMTSNIEKLRARYPDKYSDHHAADENRDRTKEEEAAVKMTAFTEQYSRNTQPDVNRTGYEKLGGESGTGET